MAEVKLTPRLPHFVWSANPLCDFVRRGSRELRWSN